jgi:hypothetical protein
LFVLAAGSGERHHDGQNSSPRFPVVTGFGSVLHCSEMPYLAKSSPEISVFQRVFKNNNASIMKTSSLCIALVFAAGLGFASAGTIGIGVVTDDASTGVDNNLVYTHAVSGGGAGSINGVTLDVLNPTSSPANFAWASSGGMNIIGPAPNNNNWNPALGGVTGAGALGMFGNFTFAGAGANEGSTQSFTLSGLTPGVPHEMRLFIRPWDQGGSGRPIDLTFTGLVSDPATPPGGAPEDRPSLVIGAGNDHQAYYVSYNYLPSAAGTLVIDANVPIGAPTNSGSFHMYGLTNAVVPEPSSMALIGLGCLGLLRRRR